MLALDHFLDGKALVFGLDGFSARRPVQGEQRPPFSSQLDSAALPVPVG